VERVPVHAMTEVIQRLGTARRGGRYPAAAPTVAVGATRRLRCDARSTRAAAMPLAVALNAPLPHGFSPVRPLRRPTARPACRAGSPGEQESAGTLARPGSPPRVAALLAAPQVAATGYRLPRRHAGVLRRGTPRCPGKAVGGCASAATLRGAEERRVEAGARAARASTSDSRRLSERSERRERSEFRRAASSRAPQGSRPAGPTAVHERRRMPARGFAPHGFTQGARDR
jgi:hypothetical protein